MKFFRTLKTINTSIKISMKYQFKIIQTLLKTKWSEKMEFTWCDISKTLSIYRPPSPESSVLHNLGTNFTEKKRRHNHKSDFVTTRVFKKYKSVVWINISGPKSFLFSAVLFQTVHRTFSIANPKATVTASQKLTINRRHKYCFTVAFIAAWLVGWSVHSLFCRCLVIKTTAIFLWGFSLFQFISATALLVLI